MPAFKLAELFDPNAWDESLIEFERNGAKSIAEAVCAAVEGVESEVA